MGAGIGRAHRKKVVVSVVYSESISYIPSADPVVFPDTNTGSGVTWYRHTVISIMGTWPGPRETGQMAGCGLGVLWGACPP